MGMWEVYGCVERRRGVRGALPIDSGSLLHTLHLRRTPNLGWTTANVGSNPVIAVPSIDSHEIPGLSQQGSRPHGVALPTMRWEWTSWEPFWPRYKVVQNRKSLRTSNFVHRSQTARMSEHTSEPVSEVVSGVE